MDIANCLISIILPVYNREKYIEECVHSVQAQSYPNFEIVIVDDGSSDHTYEICKRLAAEDNRIKLHQAEHGGVSAARNIALDVASGEYVFFLDSDDVIYPLLLETLVAAMQSSNAHMGGTDVVGMPENRWHRVQTKIKEPPIAGTVSSLTFDEAIEAMFCGNSPLGCVGGVMMHKNLIGNTRFHTDLSIGEDFFFIYENLIKGTSCVFLAEKWYYVRNHAHNSSWDYSFNGFWTRFYRRILVWRSEESFGRMRYANIQKNDAFNCFIRCAAKNAPYSNDAKRMRRVLKKYKREFLPALSHKAQFLLCLYLYLPATTAYIQAKRTRR